MHSVTMATGGETDVSAASHQQNPIMFSDYRPRRGYDEYFAGTDEPRDTLKPLLSFVAHPHGPRQANQ